MRKTIMIILLVLFTMFLGAVDAAAAEKENTGVVKAVFKALESRDMPTLDKLMAPEPAAEMKRHTSGWAEVVKTRIDDIFGAGDKVTVRWTATGLKDGRFGLDWTINCITVFQLAGGKVVKVWNGNDFLFAMRKNRIDLVSPVPETLEQKLKATMSDIHVIGRVVSLYMEDYHYAPKVKTIKELAKMTQPFYIKTCPLEDAWGNDLIYKVDPKDPKNYWVASPGSDGKFNGFDQEGTWSPDNENGRDIILHNGNFQYRPEEEKECLK